MAILLHDWRTPGDLAQQMAQHSSNKHDPIVVNFICVVESYDWQCRNLGLHANETLPWDSLQINVSNPFLVHAVVKPRSVKRRVASYQEIMWAEEYLIVYKSLLIPLKCPKLSQVFFVQEILFCDATRVEVVQCSLLRMLEP